MTTQTQYKLLPSEPNEQILDAMPQYIRRNALISIYKAMWQAAPEVAQPNQSERALDMVKREPLSAYMIIDFLRKNKAFDELFDDGTAVKFARAIEKAHGIGVE